MSEINLKRNIMVSGSFRVINMAIMFLTSMLSTRYLGVELKGKYSYLTTLVAFGWLLLDLGLTKTYPYMLRKDKDSLSGIYTWSMVLFAADLALFGILGMVFLPLVNSLFSFEFTSWGWWIFIALVVISQLINQLHMTYLGLDQVMRKSIWETVNQALILLFVALAFIFLKNADRLNVVLLCLLIPMLAISFPYAGNLLQHFNLSKLKLPLIFKNYQMGLRVFLSSMFITLLIRADIVILKNLSGFSSVGIYSLSAHIVDMLQIASNMVGGLLLVKLSDTDDEEQKWILMKRAFMLFFVFLAAANLVFALAGKPLIRIVYGAAFENAYYSTLWLIPASFGLSFGSLFNTYLWSKGFPLVSTVIPLLVLLLNIGLNYALIPGMGIAGAALASSIAYCLWFLIILLYEQHCSGGRMMRHLVPHREDWGEVWQAGTASLASIFKGRAG
ncbi:MAG: oligosaccharide flippase family protein [Candidatus Cloacimonetes bacterium]|nr:oligosaccharide flippase family protein [Candidatus Cloacimonadota bacterium]